MPNTPDLALTDPGREPANDLAPIADVTQLRTEASALLALLDTDAFRDSLHDDNNVDDLAILEERAKRLAEFITRNSSTIVEQQLTVPTLPDTLRESIQAVVSYNWADEYRDATENGMDGHVMAHLVQLSELIGRPLTDQQRNELGITPGA